MVRLLLYGAGVMTVQGGARMKSFTLAVAMLWLVGAINVAHAVPLFSYSSTINVATAPTVPSNPPGFGAAVIGIGAGNSLTFTTDFGSGDAGQPGGSAISIGDIIFNASGNS